MLTYRTKDNNKLSVEFSGQILLIKNVYFKNIITNVEYVLLRI